MTVVRLRGIKKYTNQTSGITYVYHRRTGTQLVPKFTFGSAEFFAAYYEIDRQSRAASINKDVLLTLETLVLMYKKSDRYKELAPRTQKDYERHLQYIKFIGMKPAKDLTSKVLRALRKKGKEERGWHFARYLMQVISIVYKFGMEEELVIQNPALNVERPKRPSSKPAANRAWQSEEFDAFLSAAPPALCVPVCIGRWTGLRLGDVVALPKTSYKGGRILTVTSKRNQVVHPHCPSELRDILDQLPDVAALTLCSSSKGTAWTADGFRTSFFRLIRKLEQQGAVRPGLTFHGLRTTFLEELIADGATERQAADVAGHRDTRSLTPYLKNARREASFSAVKNLQLKREKRLQQLSIQQSDDQYP